MVGNALRRNTGEPFYKRIRPEINRPLMQKVLSFGPFSIQNGLLPDKPRNLSALTPRQRDAIARFARKSASKNARENGDFARFALLLSSWAEADQEVCWAAAMLKNSWNGRGGDQSPSQNSPGSQFLLSLKLDAGFVGRVEAAILASHKVYMPKNPSPEERVLWEAANISKMGGETRENDGILPSHFTIYPLAKATGAVKV